MKLLVFQHIACEHPGALRNYLKEDGVEWDAVQLDEGDRIPDLHSYDALWVMGGPMDVWDVAEHPWLVAEKAAIRHWVRGLQRPFLGLCLGHQLLADALGGTCGPARPPEIGIMDVSVTDAAADDPVFSGLPKTQKCLQWHSVEVAQPPEDAIVLASSAACRIQAMRVGACAWSAQYHVELEPDTISNWGAVPDYAAALEQSLGAGALDRMNQQAMQNMTEFADVSRALYDNFMRVTRATG
jgi:GMP synthase-like glutamine amidotransferase